MGGEGIAAQTLHIPCDIGHCRRGAGIRAQSLRAEEPRMTAMSAASIAERLARLPKFVLFGAAALIQIALLAVMIIDRVQVLRDGVEVTLQTRPVDPRDFLRGDYVVLGYDITQLPAGPLRNQPS